MHGFADAKPARPAFEELRARASISRLELSAGPVGRRKNATLTGPAEPTRCDITCPIRVTPFTSEHNDRRHDNRPGPFRRNRRASNGAGSRAETHTSPCFSAS